MELSEGHRVMVRLYRQCIAYEKSLAHDNDTDSQDECPVFFDGYLCWGPAKANSTEIKNCPSFVIGYDGSLTASKVCTENGSWWRHPESGREWSNYTTCINHSYYNSRQIINDIYFYGYCLSLVTLIVSLIIFLSFRSLRCTRIRIHTQMFASLAISCFLWILWYKLVVSSSVVIKEQPTWCVVLHVLTQYLMLCNYFWMFCEGVHLHLVLVVVFIKDNVAMRIFFIIGWILPLIYVGGYSFMRSRNEEDNTLCWIEESHYIWILTIPVLILLICSTIFLINIVRVLITKLHPKSLTPAPLAMKKAVRATLILIPLFGLQHVLLPFRPGKESVLEIPYQLVSAVLISLQGFCVSLLFCFCNHEVVTAVSGFLNNICPRYFATYYRNNYQPPPQTITRDVVV